MKNPAGGIAELIGNTPLLKLNNFSAAKKLKTAITAKLEYFNPAGSVKDRAALYMIQDAEEKGLLKPGAVIIEPTSGNTGIGLSCVAASRGYRVILTMPDSMSTERRKLLAAYGAELVLTDGSKGMAGAIDKAGELLKITPNAFMPGQFTNEANVKAHEETTGPEIWSDTGGKADIFVAGIGSGGTITGVGRFLKKKNPNLHIIAVEPSASPVLSQGKSGAHKLQGIGAGFVPEILDTSIYDEIITVSTEEAYAAVRETAKTEGLFVGVSSGAAVYAASVAALRAENADKTIVVILPDSGERYLSLF